MLDAACSILGPFSWPIVLSVITVNTTFSGTLLTLDFGLTVLFTDTAIVIALDSKIITAVLRIILARSTEFVSLSYPELKFICF